MLSYLKLMRPLNGVMSLLAVFIGALLVFGFSILTMVDFYIALLVTFLVAGAGNAINDWVDVEADKINKPNRPIPSGKVTARKALVFSIALFAIGIILAGFINTVAFFIAIVNSLILVIYPLYLQDRLLLGNIAVSYLVGSTFLFGGAAVAVTVGEIVPTFLLLLLAFFANLAREIVKDMEDMEGDKKSLLKRIERNVKERVAAIGERFDLNSMEPNLKYKKALVGLAELSLALAIIVSPVPYFIGLFGFAYLIFVVPADLMFFTAMIYLAVSTKRSSSITEKAKEVLFGKKVYKRSSKMIKLGMFLGLLAFVIGAIF